MIRKDIRYFNKNKSKELYKEYLNKLNIKYNKCICCDDVIYYHDSIFRINKNNEIYLDKKSYQTYKNIFGKKYYLSVCEDCLIKKYPEYNTLNKSRIFNRICDITIYVFNIPEDISEKWKTENYSITLKTMINKYGKVDGENKWKIYCNKQSISNSLKYKKEKYNWTYKQYKEFNKSRAVTLNNCIKKHGKDKGTIIWNEYKNKQRYTCTLEYFKEKYGEDGIVKWNNFNNSRINNNGFSIISQKLFNEIDKRICEKYTTYYATKNYEYEISDENHLYYLDYYITELNIAIEFNGNLWHGNPEIYNENDKVNPFNENILAKDVWKKDKERIIYLKTRLNNIVIIWEKELKEKGIDNVINDILGRLN